MFKHFIFIFICSIVDGQWSDWMPWGDCSVTCGGGSQSRSRTCTNPVPANGGKDCVGDSVDTRDCSTGNCPGISLKLFKLLFLNFVSIFYEWQI